MNKRERAIAAMENTSATENYLNGPEAKTIKEKLFMGLFQPPDDPRYAEHQKYRQKRFNAPTTTTTQIRPNFTIMKEWPHFDDDDGRHGFDIGD